jgi:hypothetical protein
VQKKGDGSVEEGGTASLGKAVALSDAGGATLLDQRVAAGSRGSRCREGPARGAAVAAPPSLCSLKGKHEAMGMLVAGANRLFQESAFQEQG